MTKVFLFGSGDCGQLGMGEEVDSLRKPRQHPFFNDKHIVALAAGGLHSLALSDNGQVWSWGCNDEKALGHEAPEFTVGLVHGLPPGIVQIAAGDSISAALTKEGRVWSWGTFRDSKGVMGHTADSVIQPHPVESQLSERVVYVAAGSNHLMAITAEGEVYAWGCGEQGQLGRRILERHKMLALKPVNVTPRLGRSRVKVQAIACGSYHSLLLDHEHRVWSMGLNNYGQLGLGDHEDRLTAELVELPAKAMAMAAGEHHSLILLSDGTIMAMGRADSGQLGMVIAERAVNTPRAIPNLSCSQIAVGGNHNLAYDGKQVYTWGYGEMHQLGHGQDEDQVEPRALAGIAGVLQLAAGGQHSIILTQ